MLNRNLTFGGFIMKTLIRGTYLTPDTIITNLGETRFMALLMKEK